MLNFLYLSASSFRHSLLKFFNFLFEIIQSFLISQLLWKYYLGSQFCFILLELKNCLIINFLIVSLIIIEKSCNHPIIYPSTWEDLIWSWIFIWEVHVVFRILLAVNKNISVKDCLSKSSRKLLKSLRFAT